MKEQVIWIIRWMDLDPQKLECRSGTRDEVEDYAKKKAKVEKSRYVIV